MVQTVDAFISRKKRTTVSYRLEYTHILISRNTAIYNSDDASMRFYSSDRGIGRFDLLGRESLLSYAPCTFANVLLAS